MIRNLKTLGLALGAVLAFSAFGASAASAEVTLGQLTSDGAVTLTGTESTGEGAGPNRLTSFGGTTECAGSTYTGHAVLTHKETEEGKEHSFLPSGAKAVTVTPHYNQENCVIENEAGSEFSATIDLNGCDYVFTVGEKTGEHTYGVKAHVTCPESSPGIQVTAFAGGSHGFRVCTVTVPGGQELEGAHLTHTTDPADDFHIEGTFTGIEANQSGLCGSASTNEGEFHADVTVQGHNLAGEPTEVTITDTTVGA